MRYEPTGRRKIIEDAHRKRLKEHIQRGGVSLTVVEKERLDPTAPDHVTLRIGFEGKDPHGAPVFTGGPSSRDFGAVPADRERAVHAAPNDYLLLRWHNTPDAVTTLIHQLGDDPDRPVTVNTFHSELFPGRTVSVPLRKALSDHVEARIAGVPLLERYNLHNLAKSARAGRSLMKDFYRMADGVIPPDGGKSLPPGRDVSLSAVIDSLNGTAPDTETLFSLQPRIAYRPYTMSSFRRTGDNRFYAEITVSVVTRELFDVDGTARTAPGRATSYISTLEPGDVTTGYILPDRHQFPQTRAVNAPLIVVSTGAGIAGPLSLLRAGYHGGPLWVIDGVRDGGRNLLYGSELKRYASDGTIARLDIAESRPSREGSRPRRVTDILNENREELLRWLDDGAHLFLSGQLSMGVSVNSTLVDILARSKYDGDRDRGYRQLRRWYEDQRFQASVSRV